VYRVYKAEGLMVRRLRRKRLSRVAVASHLVRSNQEWLWILKTGRDIGVLTVVDAFTRETFSSEVDGSLSSLRVTRALKAVIERRGTPETIRCDNGRELTSRHFLSWREERKIPLIHIQPGRPMQNGHVKGFNGQLRDECLKVAACAPRIVPRVLVGRSLPETRMEFLLTTRQPANSRLRP